MVLELLFRTNVRGVNNMSKRYVIINKKRFFTFITISILLLIILITMIVSFSNAHSMQEDAYIEYRVGEGDNLWKISDYYSPGQMDIRQFIYEIQKLNDMKTGAIYENDIIKIPLIQQ